MTTTDVNVEDIHDGERDAILEAVASQARELFQRDAGEMTCPCGTVMPLKTAFRCLYCEVWFCRECAMDHFGPLSDDEAGAHPDNQRVCHIDPDADVPAGEVPDDFAPIGVAPPDDDPSVTLSPGDSVWVVTHDGVPVTIEPTGSRARGFVAAHRDGDCEWGVYELDVSDDVTVAYRGDGETIIHPPEEGGGE